MRVHLPLTLAAALAAATPAAATDWKYSNVADLVADAMPSFVNIYNRHATKSDDATGGAATAVEDDVGSGVVISPDGYIVTNRHVVAGAYALFVTLADGRRLPAKLVLTGSAYDLATIKVDPGDKKLKPARLGDSNNMRLGDRVVAIGNPLGFASSVSSGIISAFHRQIGLSAYDDLIQTDATINRGNSGGPLFNMNGEVIGINQAIYTQNKGGSIGIGFAIPIDDFKNAHEDVVKHGRPRLGWLGVTIQTVSEPMARAFGLGPDAGGGAIVGSVKPNSPAARAGLQNGDIVRTFDGEALADTVALNRAVARSAGKKVELGVWRKGRTIKVSADILDNPNNVWITKLADLPNVSKLGDLGGKFADRPEHDGVEITDIQRHSVAWYAGARAGDVIKKVGMDDVHNLKELGAEVAKLQKSGPHGGAIYVDGPNGPRWLYVDLLQ